MLIFSNAILEACLLDKNAPAVQMDALTPTISCRCRVEENAKNLRNDYGDGSASTAAVSITIDKNSVGGDDFFSPAFVRYKSDHSTDFSSWLQVKDVKFYDLVQSIQIVCL